MRATILALIAAFAHGCTHIQLGHNSVHHAGTHADVHFQQVVDNLARFCANPNQLPSFAVATNATNQVTDAGSGGATTAYNRVQFTGVTLPFSASRNMQENWTLKPVIEPDRLARMRCAFQIVTGHYDVCREACGDVGCISCVAELAKLNLLPKPPTKPVPPSPPVKLDSTTDTELEKEFAPRRRELEKQYEEQSAAYRKELARYSLELLPRYESEVSQFLNSLEPQLSCKFPRCWFCVADHRWEVPLSASYVGHCDGIYVYVMPEGVDALSRFTLTVLTIASSDPAAPPEVVRTLNPDGSVKEYRITTREAVTFKKAVPTGGGEKPGVKSWGPPGLFDELKAALSPSFEPMENGQFTPSGSSPIRQDSRDDRDALRGLIQLGSP